MVKETQGQKQCDEVIDDFTTYQPEGCNLKPEAERNGSCRESGSVVTCADKSFCSLACTAKRSGGTGICKPVRGKTYSECHCYHKCP